MNLLQEVKNIFSPVLAKLLPDLKAVQDALTKVKPTLPEHGDYQASFAMSLQKVLGKKPQEVAKLIIDAIPPNDIIASTSIAGPGFINIKLKDDYIAALIRKIATDGRLGIANSTSPKTFVIDYSGPNVAKPLHVGHLRSTIIGDALVRILRFLGHQVIGDNHLGDWGTQFGILIYGYKNYLDETAFQKDPIRELARLYVHVRKLAKLSGDEDEGGGEIMDACRNETAKLHAGDAENVALWQKFMPSCLEMLQPIYQQLGVHIDHSYGESHYHKMLADVVADLLAKGIAQESDGAVVVPNANGVIPKSDKEKETEEPPALIRKRDGAYTYTTTDLATIKFRVDTWHPHVMLYVVDARQALHFKTLFANAKRWGHENIEFVHVAFGSILGPDRKPYRTRDGGTIELSVLLNDAMQNALEKYEQSCAVRKAHGHEVEELNDTRKSEIAQSVGIGAVKYADLSGNRTSDYIFDYDRMLSTEGNTATYMQYAYARCRAIFRKGNANDATFRTNPPQLLFTHPAERSLALHLLKLEEVLAEVAAKYEPHHICAFLWDLAKAFSVFYDNCKVVDEANAPEVQASRLLLVDLTARTLQQALDLLGIRTVERM